MKSEIRSGGLSDKSSIRFFQRYKSNPLAKGGFVLRSTELY